jgi:DNA segregation ATPase FtsK/SpoIIIE-like protein
MEKQKKNDIKETDSHTVFQIWGLIYFAGAAYLFIAITNNFIAPKHPLFGPWLGTYFAIGMKGLFGTIPQFLLIPSLCYVGIIRFKNQELDARKPVSFFLFLVFVCTAFAIPHLPIIKLSPSIPGGNLLGCAIAKYIIYPVFEKAVFGAYFSLFLAAAITAIYMSKINVVELAKLIWAKIGNKKGNVADTQENYSDSNFEIQEISKNEEENYSNTNSEKIEVVEILEKKQQPQENFNNYVSSNFESKKEEGSEENHGLPAAYIRPVPSILPNFTIAGQNENKRRNDEISKQLIAILEEFGIRDCKVVEVNPGPVVTIFEIEPGKGVKIAAFEGLEKDIGIKIGGKSVRIDTIPNKTTIGIEVPNEKREMVHFKEILQSEAFQNCKMKLPVIIGKGTTGEPLVEDIAKMPHILIAGQTGSGKSVGINSFIASLLFSKTPDELRFIMVDPKKVEMAGYEGIPHLAIPVVTEAEKAVKALEAATKEMDSRYNLLKKAGSKNIDSFNEKFENGELKQLVRNGVLENGEDKKMCYIVVIIDELADLMMTAGKEVEKYIQRIAQLARAVGIHLIVATQRPDVKVITGNIKANLPSRIAFRVMSKIDSRTILDYKGADQLLGNGDMLYLKNGAPKIVRYHGAFISEKDVENLVEEIKKQGYVCENMASFEISDDDEEDENDVVYKDDGYYKSDFPEEAAAAYKKSSGRKYGERDSMFEEAARMVVISKFGSTSSIQRHLNLGYARAGRVMDELQKAGIVGPQEVIGKPRKVLVSESELENILEELQQEGE